MAFLFSHLDKPITKVEILENINKLKNNKAAGVDQICNEYIKNTKDIMIGIYEKLFNLVFFFWCSTRNVDSGGNQTNIQKQGE